MVLVHIISISKFREKIALEKSLLPYQIGCVYWLDYWNIV